MKNKIINTSEKHLKNKKNIIFEFKKKITSLFLENCEDCEIYLSEKCYTKITVFRCKNIKLFFKKQIYNLILELNSGIEININEKYKDLIYVYTTACYDIKLFSNNKKLPIKYNWFSDDSFSNSYYLDKWFVDKYR